MTRLSLSFECGTSLSANLPLRGTVDSSWDYRVIKIKYVAVNCIVVKLYLWILLFTGVKFGYSS
jgi:hypothetical protein